MKRIYLTILVINFFILGSLSLGVPTLPAAEPHPYQPTQYVQVNHVDWSKNATIYEVNIRQYTKEGTFKAFEKHLPRLKELGVDILWLMPIHPIGEKHRKGGMGSYYSVKDYYGVNPEFGTLEDFKQLVNTIHAMGMYVILDWVANHSAWDNPLTTKHPQWYTRNHVGEFQPTPWYDWSDIIDFDYRHPGVRKYMTEAMTYWIKETDIDGFRCDVAGFIPTDFWDNVRKQLDAIKPVFMLAEWNSRDLHRHAFDMSYAWELYDAMQELAMGEESFPRLYEYFAHHANTFPKNAFRMNFVDNHDKNSWVGTQFSQFGEALDACIVLTVTAEGMPLIYSGQEAGLDKQLEFFEKDQIEWKEHYLFDFYKKLFALKKANQALWNGSWGGEMIPIENSADNVLSFARQKANQKVLVAINFSNQTARFSMESQIQEGVYQDFNTDETRTIAASEQVDLPAWGYLLLTQ